MNRKQSGPVKLTGDALAFRNELIDARDKQRCARCAVYADGGSRHHRKIRSQGGGDEVSNGILLCGSGTTGCHGWVHAHPRAARGGGLMVRSYEDPRVVPVLHAVYGAWVFLDDAGGVSLASPDPVSAAVAA